MDALPSLTLSEARRRAELLDVERYDLDVDLTGLLEGDALRATSTIRFRCAEPGATTFVECPPEVERAELNGVTLAGAEGPRIELTGLQADNELVVTTVQRDTGRRTGVHRSVDPSDGEVYVWTSFEPDAARRAWACFDQPDLKAVFAFAVTAPASWTVLSSSGDAEVTDVDGGRRWVFADTPRLSTYVPALNAGPFAEVRRTTADHDLGLYSRRSLAGALERDADELFDLTEAGLAFFGERFALPFPQRRYDQVWVPELGGAMENYGCITWSDALLYRTPPSAAQSELRGRVLLHEMAHMWFGDMVTMRWWDDLWLNEAFAEWACHWAAAAATPYRDAWASFLAGRKAAGYAADRAPSRHPIRQAAPDVAAAAAGFDQITYAKGAAVLKQLVATVGEDRFVEGLRAYFAQHAWGNATLDDLMAEVGRASGRDLTGWTAAWLESAGTDTLTLSGDVLRVEAADGRAPRPHRLDVGCYAGDGDLLVLRDAVELELTGPETRVASAEGDLVLVNDRDLAFAAVRPDQTATRRLVADAARLPTPLARTVALTTLWQLLETAELDAASFVDAGVRVLAAETAEALVEPQLRLVVQAADAWSPDGVRDGLLERVADLCLSLAGTPALRVAALRGLASTAVTDAQLDRLAEAVEGDVDLRWRRLVRLAALGRLDPTDVDALLAEDRDPDAGMRALVVRTAAPDAAAKQEAWDALLSGTRVPLGTSRELGAAFWQRSQAELLRPFAQRYDGVLEQLGTGGMIPAMTASDALFPQVGLGADELDPLVASAGRPGVNPIVTRTVVERADTLRRMLAARG